MILDQRYYIDIMTQLKAARAALKSIELNILEKHFQHCLKHSAVSANKDKLLIKIKELLNLTKEYD
ncbi:MAG: metal-sensitive transcriptional regulator [Burkholderiales bacterium]